MFGLSVGHLLVLGVVVLLFGGKRLPELGAGLGEGLRAFKGALEGKTVAAHDIPVISDSQKDTGLRQS